MTCSNSTTAPSSSWSTWKASAWPRTSRPVRCPSSRPPGADWAPWPTRRRLRRDLEQVLIEPLDVVVHRRAMALRLRGSMADPAEALVHDQLRRDVVVLQALVQLVRIRQRHALVGRAVLNERRRLRLPDVGDGGGLRVNLRIVPRRRFQVLARERMDVGVDVVRHPVGDACAGRDRLEPRGISDWMTYYVNTDNHPFT